MEQTESDIQSLLESLYQLYGYDFRDYSRAHVRRRLSQRLRLCGFENFRQIEERLKSDKEFTTSLLKDLSINVTEMFRDPDFYLAIRSKVVALLRTWSFIRIWHAGCSTGEEVYSMAILLKEEGVYERTQIYATDFNQFALQQAKDGIYAAENMKMYARNYQLAGAKGDFSDYYHAQYDSAIMSSELKKNIVWAHHNLVTDSDFVEVHMVVCRNVLIYFNSDLQNRVYDLFSRSLVNGGVLCLGKKETLRFSDQAANFSELDPKQKIYKKKYDHD